MTAAARLLDALASAGVRHLFGNPGSTELPLVEALGAQDAVRFVLGPTEAAVMGMADGYAQAGRRLGVVNVHVQPGMANALSGVLNAARARVPLLVTVGQQVQAMLPGAPFLGGDVLTMTGGLVKGAWEVARARDLDGVLADAVRLALTPPWGPVVVSLPLDVQAAPAPAGPLPVLPVAPLAAPPPDPVTLARAAAVLAGAARPVVIAGDGVDHARAGDAVMALAERLGAPVWSEPQPARVPVDTAHPHWRGALPPFAEAMRGALAAHDVVLALGMPVFRLFGWSPGPPLPDGARLVHLDPDPDEVGRMITPEIGLVGDVGEGVRALAAALGPGRGPVLDPLAGRPPPAPAEVVSPAHFSHAVQAALRPDDLLVDECVTTTRPMRAPLRGRAPGSWLAHRGSALGWGLPAAVGAGLAAPGRRVMCLHGDGSVLFGLPALWTAAHEGVPVALVVADNGGYEILRAGMEGLTGRAEGPWPGLALTAPRIDLEALARGFGASAARVGRPADLPLALDDLWRRTADGPAVLVVDVAGRTAPVGGAFPFTP